MHLLLHCIIGASIIDKKVIELLKNHHIAIYVFDPFLPDEKAKALNVTKTFLEEIFVECDIVSNHLANNEQTKGILNYNLFSRMKTNATFINTGRGAQVAENDLIKVLSGRPDITALLDVTFPEPPEKDSTLCRIFLFSVYYQITFYIKLTVFRHPSYNIT